MLFITFKSCIIASSRVELALLKGIVEIPFVSHLFVFSYNMVYLNYHLICCSIFKDRMSQRQLSDKPFAFVFCSPFGVRLAHHTTLFRICQYLFRFFSIFFKFFSFAWFYRGFNRFIGTDSVSSSRSVYQGLTYRDLTDRPFHLVPLWHLPRLPWLSRLRSFTSSPFGLPALPFPILCGYPLICTAFLRLALRDFYYIISSSLCKPFLRFYLRLVDCAGCFIFLHGVREVGQLAIGSWNWELGVEIGNRELWIGG